MTTITATEFKKNFKFFGDTVSKGERLLIKRPKKEPNLVVLNEDEYKEINRLISYYKMLSEELVSKPPATVKKRDIIGIAKGKLFYPDEFDDMNIEIMNNFYDSEDSLL